MRRLADERGFTLPELVMVIILLGILAVVVSPSGGFFPGMKVATATARVQSDIRYAQQMARQIGGPVGLSFANTTRYTVVSTAAYTPVADPVRPTKSLGFDTAAENQFQGVTFAWSLPTGNGYLLFDSMGQLRDAAYDVATSPATVTLALSGSSGTVTVEPITGRVSTTVTP